MYHRFLSPDPARDQHFEDTQSWNIYSYVGNNPTMHIDSNGMEKEFFAEARRDGAWKNVAPLKTPGEKRVAGAVAGGLGLVLAGPVAEGVAALARPIIAAFTAKAASDPGSVQRTAETVKQAVQSGEAPALPQQAQAVVNAVDPGTIRFTQDSISGAFSKGGASLANTIEGLKSGAIDPAKIPAIRVFQQEGQTFTLDNRRLYVFQQAGVAVRTVAATAQEVAKEAWKMTTQNGGTSIRVRGQ